MFRNRLLTLSMLLAICLVSVAGIEIRAEGTLPLVSVDAIKRPLIPGPVPPSSPDCVWRGSTRTNQ